MRGERPPQYLKSALECAACLVRVSTLHARWIARVREQAHASLRRKRRVCYLKSGVARVKACVRVHILSLAGVL